MNTNPEEQALLADAAQLRRERMQIGDTEATEAIRRGFANRSASRKRRSCPMPSLQWCWPCCWVPDGGRAARSAGCLLCIPRRI